MCWRFISCRDRPVGVSVAGCLGYDVLVHHFDYLSSEKRFQLLVV